jgi:hypothetical protein
MLSVSLHCLKESGPGHMQLQEHLIGNFGGQRLVGFCPLDAVKDGRVV